MCSTNVWLNAQIVHHFDIQNLLTLANRFTFRFCEEIVLVSFSALVNEGFTLPGT